MKGLEMARLGSIADIRAGYPFRSGVLTALNGNCAVVQAKDLKEVLLTNDMPFAKFDVEKVKPPHLLKKNDILLSSRGEFRASLFLSTQRAVASNLLFVISVADRCFLPEYLVMYLNSKAGRAQMNSRQTLGTVAAIIRSELEQIEIPELTLEKQKALSQAYLLLKKEERLSEQLLNYKKMMLEYALFKNMGE